MTNVTPPDAGKNSLKRESKYGLVTALAVTIGTDLALQWLTDLDTSSWTGQWAPIGVAAVATVIGLLTAYKTKNRVR